MKSLRLIDIHESRYDDLVLSIQKWGRACKQICAGRNPETREGLMSLLRDLKEGAHRASGLRCHLLEHLGDETEPFAKEPGAISHAIELTIEIACDINDPDPQRVHDHLGGLEGYQHSFENYVHFRVATDVTSPIPFAQWMLMDSPGALVRSAVPELIRPSRTRRALAAAITTTDHCTQGQRAAIASLLELIEIKRASEVFAGWKPRTAALLVGPSGAGKSSIYPTIARKASLALWSSTTGSWAPRSSTNAGSAANRLHAHLVEHGPSLIVVDEADKIHTRGDNANYYAAIFDELLALLDGRVRSWGWSGAARKALTESHWIFAGAFQQLYEAKLGPDIMFAEQVEALTLTDEDVFGAGWLPMELLNRVSATLVEVRLPDCEEVERLMSAIDRAAGFETPPVELKRSARQAVISLRGLRGIEAYALKVARKKLALGV